MLGKVARKAFVPTRGFSSNRIAKRAYTQHSIHLPEIGEQTKGRIITTFVPEDHKRKIKDPKSQPSLVDVFPGVPTEATSIERKAPETKISTLPNGIRVASEENFSQMTGIGLFVQAGTRYETDETYGSSMLLERLAFKSTANRTLQETSATLEHLGAHVSTSSSREVHVLSGECLRPHTDVMMSIMADTIKSPSLTTEEIEDQLNAIGFEYEALQKNGEQLVTDALHEVAFQNSALGRPLFVPLEQLSKLTPNTLKDYLHRRFCGSTITIAGAGIDHDELVQLARLHFGDIPKLYGNETEESLAANPTTYVGGEGKVISTDRELEKVHMGLALKAPGFNDPDFYVLYTLQTLMGGGGSFSAGGPGKGMYSRLYTDVLNRYGWVESCEAFVTSYADIGLFGLYSQADFSSANDMMRVAVAQLINMQHVGEVELARARNMLKTSIFYALETRNVQYDDIGRQIVMGGKRFGPQELCDLIDSVTPKDIARVVQRLLAAPPSVAWYGPQSVLASTYEYKLVRDALAGGKALPNVSRRRFW